MPKVVQYQPDQIQSQVVSQPRAGDIPSGAFGAPITEGITDLALAGIQLKKRIDTTSAEESMVQFERDKNDVFFNPDIGYFNTQGRDAYDSSVAAAKAIEDLKLKHGENLNADSKLLFDRSADRVITRSQIDIQRHASKGLKAWEISTIEAQVENTIENASLFWSDSERLKVQNILGRQAVIDSSDMMGISPEATAENLQTFESSFAQATIEAATQNSSVDGKQSLEDYGDKLEGPGKAKMQSLVERKGIFEKTQDDARAALLTADKLVDQYDNRSDIKSEVDKIEDLELRKKTMTEAMSQFSRKQQVKKEQENENYQSAIALVNKGLSPIGIQAQDSTAWLGMSDSQRNNILSGKHVITDQILLSNLRLLPTLEKAKLNPTDYSDKLRPSDLQKLTTEVKNAKKGQQGSRVKSLSAKSMTAAESAFGKRSKWVTGSGKATKEGKRANEFLSDLQDAIDEFEKDKGAKITPAEENQIISEFTRQIVIERSTFGLDILAADIEIDLSNAPAKDIRVLNRIIDNTSNIILEDLVGAYQYLIDNNQPVTPNSLSVVYRQGRQ